MTDLQKEIDMSYSADDIQEAYEKGYQAALRGKAWMRIHTEKAPSELPLGWLLVLLSFTRIKES